MAYPPTNGRLNILLGELRPLAAASAAAGAALPESLVAAGLQTDLLQSPDTTPVSLSSYFRFWEHAAQSIQDETLGVSRRSLLPGSTHFVLSRLPVCSNLFAAMKEIASAYNFLHGGSFNHVEMRGDRVSYIIDDSMFPYVSGTDKNFRAFAMECVLIFLHSILVLVTSDALNAKLLKLRLTRERKPGIGRHLDFWHVPLRFKCDSYALIYHPSAAELPVTITAANMPHSRAVFHKIGELIEWREASLTRQDRIRERVASILVGGVTSQQAVASLLGLSVASLRRRLSEEGTSFRALCHAARNDRAKFLLKQGLSVPEVAERLGFSDFRSFTRAFKNWNETTPRSYRLSE